MIAQSSQLILGVLQFNSFALCFLDFLFFRREFVLRFRIFYDFHFFGCAVHEEHIIAEEYRESLSVHLKGRLFILFVGHFPICQVAAITAHRTNSDRNGCTTQIRRILIEQLVEIRILGFMVFGAMNQFINIALLLKITGIDAFNSIPVFIDNANQIGERLAINTNSFIEIYTTINDSYLIARCNIQSTHLPYGSL